MAARKYRTPPIEGQFIYYPVEMLNSIAWKMLNNPDKQVLELICIENQNNNRTENGKLITTYNQFVEHGVSRNAIAKSIARLEALGFIVAVSHGRPSRGDMRVPAKYRITFYHGCCDSSMTLADHLWKQIKTREKGQRRIKNKLDELRMRTLPQQSAGKKSAIKKKIPVTKTKLVPVDKTQPNLLITSHETSTTALVE